MQYPCQLYKFRGENILCLGSGMVNAPSVRHLAWLPGLNDMRFGQTKLSQSELAVCFRSPIVMEVEKLTFWRLVSSFRDLFSTFMVMGARVLCRKW